MEKICDLYQHDTIKKRSGIEEMNKLSMEIKERFDESGRHTEGKIERLEERVYNLEVATAHLLAWIANRLNLTEEEVHNENGLTDF